ncbi:MAG: hypothetical protein KDD66_02500 [Bdellovibrionales bacterium]|nr:hypothetical protein [Bdellovibrionales bacterium]
MHTRVFPIVNLAQLLHPLQLRSGCTESLDWAPLEGGARLHQLGTLTTARASRGQVAKPIAGLLASAAQPARIPVALDGSPWRRGWSIVIPIVGAAAIGDRRIEEQHLAAIPPGSDEELLTLDADSVVMMFHPGQHACQREAFVRGSLDGLLRTTAVNQRFLRDAYREGWEGGVVAYRFDGSDGDSGVNISLLELPALRRQETHRHGNRGEFSMLIGGGGRIEVGSETLTGGCFDLEGPRTMHQLRVLEPCWALQVSLDGVELETD